MFAGQLACEALNWLLKRTIREERPHRRTPHLLSSAQSPFLTNVLYRSDGQRLWHAFVSRPIRLVLRSFLDPVPALATQPAHSEHVDDPYPNLHFRKTRLVRTGHSRRCCCRPEQDIPELPHREADPRRLHCGCPFCSLLVSLHNLPASLRLAGLGLGHFNCQVLPSERPGRQRGSG